MPRARTQKPRRFGNKLIRRAFRESVTRYFDVSLDANPYAFEIVPKAGSSSSLPSTDSTI
ncbi:hypothetical protein WG66_001484 [Moniliophthora roreri]|nr:hypothetical protein WG66_001484 [Moniliophthora roreri]